MRFWGLDTGRSERLWDKNRFVGEKLVSVLNKGSECQTLQPRLIWHPDKIFRRRTASSWNLQILIEFRIFSWRPCAVCVCAGCCLLRSGVGGGGGGGGGGRMSFSAVLLLSWFERGGSDSSTHQCRCSLTSSRQILDLSLCPVTLDCPQPLYILTNLQGFKESRFSPTPTCPPPPPPPSLTILNGK